MTYEGQGLRCTIIFKPVLLNISYLRYSWTLWVVAWHAQGHPLKSKVKHLNNVMNFNICHNFRNIAGSYLIFGMHVYYLQLHNLNGNISRSKVKSFASDITLVLLQVALYIWHACVSHRATQFEVDILSSRSPINVKCQIL